MSKKSSIRNPIVTAMFKRHGSTTTIMKDRRLSRPNDYKNTEGTYMDDIDDVIDDAPEELLIITGLEDNKFYKEQWEVDRIISELGDAELQKKVKVVRYIKA